MGRYAFFQGGVVPIDEAKISVKTHAFLYGTAVFEGIRAYWVDDEQDLLVFRMKEHFVRLLESCRILRIRPKYSADELCAIAIDLLKRNGNRQDMYLRPIYYKSG